ncbi:MAG TPA: hypothetical protein VLD16_13095 [Gaiellaceae bacterium]|nr:hypothetical protein [Gaiellaceae bacterium]
MDERARRVGLNEALFRTVNEEVRELSDRFAVVTEPMSVVCECERGDCFERVDVRAEEYEHVRSDATLFIVRPGHEATDVESVVEDHGDYRVVRKHEGVPADIARRTDDLT